MAETLIWEHVADEIDKAKKQLVPDMWPTTGPQILEKLCGLYPVDLTDRRQLYYLMVSLGFNAPGLASVAQEVIADQEFFGLDQTETQLLTFFVLQAWAGLILELSEHLPPEVCSGRLKREQIDTPKPRPEDLEWSAIAPHPEQVERHKQWMRSQVARVAPAVIADRDQANAIFRDMYTSRNTLLAYMTVVACSFLVTLAGVLDPDEAPSEGAQRFRDVVIVEIYNTLPPHLQALGRD